MTCKPDWLQGHATSRYIRRDVVQRARFFDLPRGDCVKWPLATDLAKRVCKALLR